MWIELCIVLLLCFFCVVLIWKKKPIIPNVIYTFWHDPSELPPTIRLCMESWRKQNPDFTIILLTKHNYNEYIDIDPEIANHPIFNDSFQRFSDLIRLSVLEKYGGYWMDASILLRIPLSDFMFRQNRHAEISCFYLDGWTIHTPIIESWMFACKPRCRFVRLWRREFLEMRRFQTPDDYVESRKKMGVDLQNMKYCSYLAIHVAAQKVLQIDRYPLDTFDLQQAEQGPYLYLAEADWISHQAIQNACNQPRYTILKMRGGEREYLDKHLSQDERCKWL